MQDNRCLVCLLTDFWSLFAVAAALKNMTRSSKTGSSKQRSLPPFTLTLGMQNQPSYLKMNRKKQPDSWNYRRSSGQWAWTNQLSRKISLKLVTSILPCHPVRRLALPILVREAKKFRTGSMTIAWFLPMQAAVQNSPGRLLLGLNSNKIPPETENLNK